jgi:hypothetical protein
MIRRRIRRRASTSRAKRSAGWYLGGEQIVLEGWRAFAREYVPEDLTAEERAQFDRARLADEMAKKHQNKDERDNELLKRYGLSVFQEKANV